MLTIIPVPVRPALLVSVGLVIAAESVIESGSVPSLTIRPVFSYCIVVGLFVCLVVGTERAAIVVVVSVISALVVISTVIVSILTLADTFRSSTSRYTTCFFRTSDEVSLRAIIF